MLVQDTRGRFDSEGVFDPYFHEKEDGLATIDWMEQQPWFNGTVGLWGGSYLGIVQWVIAGETPVIKALVPSITGSQLYSVLYPDGALDLGLALRWMAICDALDRMTDQSLLAELPLIWQVERKVTPAFEHLPLTDVDQAALAKSIEFYHKWLEHTDPDDALWREALETTRVDDVDAPVHLIGGWYDFFLRPMLHDYATLHDAEHTPYLTIGPWHHFNAIVSFADLREGIHWFDAHLKNDPSGLRDQPVRLYVMGADEWREMEAWPPPFQKTHLHLHPTGQLDWSPTQAEHSCDHYRYDPADPTPAVGGTQFTPLAGGRDNRELEARSDVLTYTTPPLDEDLEVIGPVWLDLYVHSSLDHTDFFGRLCDVHPDGRSINVCDGLFRIEPGQGDKQPDGSLRIHVDMWATAYRFRRGHCIRLQVSSGAHPRWSRNLGTAEQLEGTTMRIAEQTVYHDRHHPSALVLPLAQAV